MSELKFLLNPSRSLVRLYKPFICTEIIYTIKFGFPKKSAHISWAIWCSFAFTVFIIQQFILKHFETMFIMNKYTCELNGACISFSKVHCYAPRNCELSEAKNEHFSMVFISIFTQNFLFRLNERCETGSHTSIYLPRRSKVLCSTRNDHKLLIFTIDCLIFVLPSCIFIIRVIVRFNEIITCCWFCITL